MGVLPGCRIVGRFGLETVDAPPNALAAHTSAIIDDPFTQAGRVRGLYAAFTLGRAMGKKARLTRAVGLLRSHTHGGGTAGISCPAHAAVVPCELAGGGPAVVEFALPGRSVACGENLSINGRRGPVAVTVPAGKYTLHQRFGVHASHRRKLLPCKTASAEFAPDPLWISYWEPFRGAGKRDFGFQVTLKVSPEPGNEKAEK